MLTIDDLQLNHEHFYRKYGDDPKYFTLLRERNIKLEEIKLKGGFSALENEELHEKIKLLEKELKKCKCKDSSKKVKKSTKTEEK